MRGIRGKSVTKDFRQNDGSALQCKFSFFQNKNSGTLRQHKPVPILVKGATRLLRGTVASRQGAHARESCDAHRRQSGLCTAGDHDIGHAHLNEPECIANRVGP